jgi:predicted nucleotidyltransferase
MPFGLSPKYIDKINNIFRQYATIDKVIIYGSRAKGNFKESSDIDLTLLGKLDLKSINKIEQKLDDLLLPNKFDISNYYQIQNKELLDHISRVGQVFYSKND